MPTTSESRRLQLPAPLLLSLLSAVAADRTPADAAALLRQAGYDAGEELFVLLEEYMGDESDGSLGDLPASRFWERFASFWQFLGWGTLEHRQTHAGLAEMASRDWAEADAVPGGLGCQVTTGLFAELFRRLTGSDVALLEAECRSRGDSHCRFLIGAPVTLDALYDSLRSGQSPQDALARLR